jgi:two-component system chemotaxis response regulator CheY
VRPNLTFLDLTMPVMDGFDALKAIKEEDNLAVVVVPSSDIQKKTVERVVTLGADMVIPKPHSAESIQEALTKAAKLLV